MGQTREGLATTHDIAGAQIQGQQYIAAMHANGVLGATQLTNRASLQGAQTTAGPSYASLPSRILDLAGSFVSRIASADLSRQQASTELFKKLQLLGGYNKEGCYCVVCNSAETVTQKTVA